MKSYLSSKRFQLPILCLILIAGLTALHAVPRPVPARLTDDQFWKLSTSSSEQDGTFRSDNLLSNELNFQYVIPDLLSTAKQGRVYMGVGPEQNFTYIAALKPAMAFIVDIRHGNLDVHLMYKALFELSKDRAEFVSRLFSRKRPDGLTAKSTAREIFGAYLAADPSKELFDADLKAIVDQLKTKHGFSLSAGDLDGIDWALGNYYRFGPAINYNSSSAATAPAVVGATGFGGGGRGGGFSGVTYADLMMADDGNGQMRSYLASEENFAFLKDLETRNMLVPVVGRLRRPESDSRGRQIPQEYRCDGFRLLSFQCRTIPGSGRQDRRLLLQCGHPPSRSNQHVYPFRRRPRFRRRWWFRTQQGRRSGFRAWKYAERGSVEHEVAADYADYADGGINGS